MGTQPPFPSVYLSVNVKGFLGKKYLQMPPTLQNQKTFNLLLTHIKVLSVIQMSAKE